MPTTARYDQYADWYEVWVGDAPTLIADHADLMPSLTGQRVLELACGTGRLSRFLAGSGAQVVGVDLSAGLLERARAAGGGGVDYVLGDITRPEEWWDGRRFDGCVCELAFMDIDDLPATLGTVATVLRPGGWFVASLVHPCFPGNDKGLSSWPPDLGYGAEGWWTSAHHDPDGVRIRVGASHRTLSTYVNGLVDAGLELERLVEPPALVPTFLLWRCRRR